MSVEVKLDIIDIKSTKDIKRAVNSDNDNITGLNKG